MNISKPTLDLPPIADEIINLSIRRPIVVLTGGPGGGKSTLIEDLRQDSEWANKFVALPEAIYLCHFISISPKEKLFQRVMVNMQMALENGLHRSLQNMDYRPIICHRGSLDPLAYWLKRGWDEHEFFTFTGLTRQEHYQRYALVLQLVTSADGVPEHYTRWPDAHRPEEPGEAVQLDRYLEQAWRDHPHYVKIDNSHKTWESKSKAAREILKEFLQKGQSSE